jgi:hypothetical protein
VLAPACAADAATARIAFTPIATSVVPLVSDGTSAAAYMPTPTTVQVVFATSAPKMLEAPPDCVPASANSDGLRAVGGGYLLYACAPTSAAPQGYVVQSIATGALALPTGLARLPIDDSGSAPIFRAIGANWLGGTTAGHEGGSFVFDLQWHTGVQFGFRKTLGVREVEMLDEPGLRRRMCEPLRRTPALGPYDELVRGVYEPYAYERPWGVSILPRGVHQIQRVELQHCGSRHVTTLATASRGGLGQLQGGGRVVSWVSSTGKASAVHAYSLARRIAVAGPIVDESASALHVGGLLLQSTVSARAGPGNLTPTMWTISAAAPFRS